MDGNRQTPAAAAASVASVLGDDDLLREILIRLGFPNCLVRASLVSQRWLSHASDPAFLRLFRERNPPRLLGFCVNNPDRRYQFVQLPQSPELVALSRRVASVCNDLFRHSCQGIQHICNGRLIFRSSPDGFIKHSLLAPLLAGQSQVALPPIPWPQIDREESAGVVFTNIFLPEDGSRGGGGGITLVHVWHARRKVRAEVHLLGSGGWGVPTTAVTEAPNAIIFLTKMLQTVRGKVFMVTTSRYTLGLDLAAARFLMLELPAEIGRNYMLSPAEGSGLYLVNAHRFQLSVWLHRMTGDSDGAGGWLLVDTFCVREAYTHSAGHNWDWMPQDGDSLGVAAVGDKAEYAFLDYARYGVVFYVHIRSRVVQKVYERAPHDHRFIRPGMNNIHISPFTMIWPPIFPALNRGHDQEQ